ncbi:hypothetical protein ILYODFUR_007960 [Ilyodon furcidens]|uniref:Uncharacterized protein n=1 Tax=Ilyodon furcidens TaxID=33524 RepID=A0ABV0SMD9_9TELE
MAAVEKCICSLDQNIYDVWINSAADYCIQCADLSVGKPGPSFQNFNTGRTEDAFYSFLQTLYIMLPLVNFLSGFRCQQVPRLSLCISCPPQQGEAEGGPFRAQFCWSFSPVVSAVPPIASEFLMQLAGFKM